MSNQISVIILLSNAKSAEMVSSSLLKIGVSSKVMDSFEDAKKYISQNDIRFLFIDFDFSNNTAIDFVEKMNEETDTLYTIGTSFNTNTEIIKKLQSHNLISFILKPLTEENIEKKFTQILENFKDHFPQRKHIRVQPDENEVMRVSFVINNKKRISAKALDISLGGIAINLYTDYENEQLSAGKIIKNMVCHIGMKEIQVDAKIVKKAGKFISFTFVNFHGNSYIKLTKYITKRLSV